MTILTEPQRKIMKAVLDDDYRALLASKASTTVIDRLMGRHLIAWDHDRKCGRDLTPAGVRALLDAYKARWAKDGCMAYQDDLKEVEKLIAARKK